MGFSYPGTPVSSSDCLLHNVPPHFRPPVLGEIGLFLPETGCKHYLPSTPPHWTNLGMSPRATTLPRSLELLKRGQAGQMEAWEGGGERLPDSEANTEQGRAYDAKQEMKGDSLTIPATSYG